VSLIGISCSLHYEIAVPLHFAVGSEDERNAVARLLHFAVGSEDES